MDPELENVPGGLNMVPPSNPPTLPEVNTAAGEAPLDDEPSSLPTNRVRDVRVDQNGVQIITSTLNQLLDVEAIVAGEGSVQFIGTTTHETLQDVARTCIIRQTNPPIFPARSGTQAQTTSFGHVYGSGRPLGSHPDP